MATKRKSNRTVVAGKRSKARRKAVPMSLKVSRPVRNGRVLKLSEGKKLLARLTPLSVHLADIGHPSATGRLLYGVSERYLHSEVLRHRVNEHRADGLQLLKAMEAVS